MFHPQLTQLEKKCNISRNLINKFDTWLARIPNNRKKHINPSFFANECKISEELALCIFQSAVEIGILSTNYEIYCPICEEFVDSFDSMEELEDEGMNFSCGIHNFDISKNAKCIKSSFNLII